MADMVDMADMADMAAIGKVSKFTTAAGQSHPLLPEGSASTPIAP